VIFVEPLQQATAVFVVLALLGIAFYWLRARGVARFSLRGMAGSTERRLQSIERLPLTAHHSLHLVRVAGRVVLIAVSPGGCSVLDRGDWNFSSTEGGEQE
jgi:flagellar biogenesis protein FliO